MASLCGKRGLFPLGTFPKEFSSGATRWPLPRGRPATLLGKVYFPSGDLPHGIQLWRNSVAISPGKVRHLFGEGLLSRPPGTFPIILASQGPLRHFWWGRSRHFFETFPKSSRHLPHGIQLWRHSVAISPGKVCHLFGEGLLSRPQGTIPITSASQGTLCHFWRGRSRHFFETFPKSSCHLFGEGLLSLRGPSPSLWPPMALCAISGGEGHATFLRPSPNHPATFPKRTRDLPQGIQLWRHSEVLPLGKACHPFGEGLLFPQGTFPITSASHGPLCHFWRGRSRHLFETFPKSPCHLPQTSPGPSPRNPAQVPLGATSTGKVRHLFGEGLLSRPPGTFPITSASHGPLCHFRRGRSRHFLRPSQNHHSTFPKRTRDLPHCIQLWRHSEALPLGKACHPFGEGLLFPPGTFPITLASHGLLCYFRRGRSNSIVLVNSR